MKNGFVRVGAVTPRIVVADCDYNLKSAVDAYDSAVKKDIKLIVYPELFITGYTCGDLFLQNVLINSARDALLSFAEHTKGMDCSAVIGCPLIHKGKLYNCSVFISDGEILGVVPKSNIPNYNEFYEKRHFEPCPEQNEEILIDGKLYPFGRKLLFCCKQLPDFVTAIEICEDLWTPNPISIEQATAGAYVIANTSASDEVIGKDSYRRSLVCSQSARLISAYIYASAGDGESTTDMVFAGHNIISEDGNLLCETELFENKLIYSEIDLERLSYERRRITTYPKQNDDGFKRIYYSLKVEKTELTRELSKLPFVPKTQNDLHNRCGQILKMQANGLKKRLEHSHSKSLVIGISGGLDSCLALLVAVEAVDLMELHREDIIAVTMPCFGTSERTLKNAIKLCETLGVTLRTVDITKSVQQHFLDIGHDENVYDVVFENAQARERTQVLMDIANQCSGLVIGTGDLSELALGWATYNGDHMSMYGVNASVPKTLVKHIVRYYSETSEESLKGVLLDIFETPVSPELLPKSEVKDEMSQKTEDFVGPYELHDFFLYYAIRWAFSPRKIYRLAKVAFGESYDGATILKWLNVFYRRFFAQQFKRSCLPDSPKIGSVSLSPRGDWRMPSDASVKMWQRELDEINE